MAGATATWRDAIAKRGGKSEVPDTIRGAEVTAVSVHAWDGTRTLCGVPFRAGQTLIVKAVGKPMLRADVKLYFGERAQPCYRCNSAERKNAQILPAGGQGLTEEWRPIAGYEGIYSISSIGRARNDRTGRILKPALSSWGRDYLLFRPSTGNKARNLQIHVEVAKAFLGPRPVGHVVNHKNGIKTDNRAENLEYVTRLGNEKHAADNALKAWGERHGMHKLTANEVRWIRAMRRRVTRVAMAAQFGVSVGAIAGVLDGKSWRHLE